MNFGRNELREKPRRKPGLSLFLRVKAIGTGVSWRVAVLIVAGLVLIDGCGPTSPRFRSGSARPPVRPVPSSAGKDSAKARDQDVETASEQADSIISGKRSFRTEKNAAISNLDKAKMMREISKMMGVSYKLGGNDENGIDCSAYTMMVYKNSIGKPLPRSAAEQFKLGFPVEPQDLKFGDLVFFDTTGEPGSHVGIYLGDNLFAHASVSLGVTISSLESTYYKNRYNGARRIIE
jgi:cell wall-associated NlpC family hydrolase